MPAPAAGPNTKVRVVGRIRPLSGTEKQKGAKETLISLVGPNKKDPEVYSEEPEMIQVTEGNGKKRYFELDAVFDKNCTQREVYVRSGCLKAVQEDLFHGYNCTVLAYGQTGAGKSFSMGTASHGTEIGEFDGMIPRACHDLFETIKEKCDGNAKVLLQYIEIYNEELRDLLVDDKDIKPLKIRETLNGEVYIAGLEAKPVASPQEIGILMEEASSRRVVAATAMNAVSSRSHAMCVLRIEGVVETDDGSDKFSSKLTLVDLAGSERASKTGATGGRLKEGININKSLLVLGQVVSALATKDKKRARKPPYRDSKLTRLLQDSLGGNSQTIMVACASPADYNSEESINTMRYATSARNIKNTATKNVVKNISPEEAAKLQRENQLLKKQVQELQATIKTMAEESANSTASTSNSTVSSVRDDSSISDSEETEEEMEEEMQEDIEVEMEVEIEKPTKNGRAGKYTGKKENGDDGENKKEVIIIDDQHQQIIDDKDKRIKELEKENYRLKKNVQSSRASFRKSIHSKAIELPKLHLEVEQLREEVKQKDELEDENRKLAAELDMARIDAECASRAAARMSDMLEEMDQFASTRVDKTDMEFESKNKETQWITFVLSILDSSFGDVKKLASDFELVMMLVHNMIKSVPSTVPSNKGPVAQGPVPQESSRKGFFGFGGDDEAVMSAQDAKVRIGMLDDQVKFFSDGITAIEKKMEEEANSLREIKITLEKETYELREKLGREDYHEKANVMMKGRFQKRFGDDSTRSPKSSRGRLMNNSRRGSLSESRNTSLAAFFGSLRGSSSGSGRNHRDARNRGKHGLKNLYVADQNSQKNLFGIPIRRGSERTIDTQEQQQEQQNGEKNDIAHS